MNKKVSVIETAKNGIYLNIEVKSDQHESGIGVIDKWRNALQVSIAEPPVSGKANKELVRLFGEIFPEAKGKIVIAIGLKSSSKKLFIPINKESAITRLGLKI